MTATGIFRLSQRVFRPWKNGGGETAEIAVSPPGADFENFEWRISTAIVAASGPFSIFPGVDRVLTVLEGGTMVLTVGAHENRLDAASEPFFFPGDLPAAARLEGEAGAPSAAGACCARSARSKSPERERTRTACHAA
jgi:environmental stress-induced protein Ves